MFCSIWIILVTFLVAANCGLLGTFLMLRKQAMIGDAISHSVLLGVVVGFLITGSSHVFVFLGGAILIGTLTTLLIETLQRQLKISNEASIGFVFTSFFALGVLLIAFYTNKVDLDQGCVLYGELVSIIFDRWVFYGYMMGPKAVYWLGGLLVVNGAIIALNMPMLFITTFDPDMARSIGIKTKRWHYLLMILTSITAVLAFRIVGAPLVVAFFIIPPATAYLLTGQLRQTICYTLVIDIIVAIYGYWLARASNASVPGGMGTVASVLFILAFLGQRVRIAQRSNDE